MPINRSAFVALAGLPNVGKSTLLNSLLERKIAITSPRPQTTRGRVVGILTEGESQVVFLDTPGVHTAKSELGRNMNRAAFGCLADADIQILVTTPKKGPAPLEEKILAELKRSGKPAILVINKVDQAADKTRILETISAFSGLCGFAAVVPLCARNGKGVGILKKELFALLPEGVAYYPEEMVTETPQAVYCAEVIREKLLTALSEEVPHGIAVDVYRIARRENGIWDLDADIVCEKESHKAIIIGRGGEKLKETSSRARRELEEYFGEKVNLKVWVKVRADWRNDPRVIRSLGLSSDEA